MEGRLYFPPYFFSPRKNNHGGAWWKVWVGGISLWKKPVLLDFSFLKIFLSHSPLSPEEGKSKNIPLIEAFDTSQKLALPKGEKAREKGGGGERGVGSRRWRRQMLAWIKIGTASTSSLFFFLLPFGLERGGEEEKGKSFQMSLTNREEEEEKATCCALTMGVERGGGEGSVRLRAAVIK